jgi:hypothetical protein
MILLVAVAAWPAFAGAEILTPQGSSGSQLTTSPSGFVGITGPNGYSPPDQGHAYLPPPPAPACPSCAPSGQSQPPAGQPAQH